MGKARITNVRLKQLERVLRGLDGLLQDPEFIAAATRDDPLVLPVLHYHDILSWLLESLPGKLKCIDILRAISDRWPQLAAYADQQNAPPPQVVPERQPASERPRGDRPSTDSCQQRSLKF